jgi:hypothetical protein
MQNIDPETIYELTPEGHDVMQHRSLQLPTELRFLLMLINGMRTVGTLRVVTPAAKYDDAGFIILMEYGLIHAINALAIDAPQKVALASDVAVASDDDVRSLPQPAFIESSLMPALETHAATVPEILLFKNAEIEIVDTVDQEATELFAFEPEQSAAMHDIELASAPAPDLVFHIENTLSSNVSSDDRQAVEIILQRTLKQDAKFAIDQLSQKRTYADFLPAVKRLETAIRETVSMTEADALRSRFSEAF